MFEELDLKIDAKGSPSPALGVCTCETCVIIIKPVQPEHAQLCTFL